MPNLISDVVGRIFLAKDTDESTATSYTVTPSLFTTTEPTRSATRAVLSFKDNEFKDRTTLRIIPFGSNANNETGSVKVIGWTRHVLGSRSTSTPDVDLWASSMIAQVSCTMSSALVGVANQLVIATDLFCDTISLTYGVAVIYQGLADVDYAWFTVDTGGFEMVELLFARGTGDTMNALVSY